MGDNPIRRLTNAQRFTMKVYIFTVLQVYIPNRDETILRNPHLWTTASHTWYNFSRKTKRTISQISPEMNQRDSLGHVYQETSKTGKYSAVFYSIKRYVIKDKFSHTYTHNHTPTEHTSLQAHPHMRWCVYVYESACARVCGAGRKM